MLDIDDLVVEIEAMIATLSQLVNNYGETIKLPIEGENEQELKEGKLMYQKHLRFFGEVGLVSEFVTNEKYFDVTVAPHIIAFWTTHFDSILTIMNKEQNNNYEVTLKAFHKMFPPERNHCSKCCDEVVIE